MTKENRKARLRTGLFLLCGYYWCVYMSRSDSYFAPYLLVAGFGLLRFMRSRGAGECAGKRWCRGCYLRMWCRRIQRYACFVYS